MKKIKFGFILGVIISLSALAGNAQQTVDWEETFSTNLDDWTFYAYNFTTWSITPTEFPIESGFHIDNGVLIGRHSYGGNLYSNGNWSRALHNSSVSKGVWEMDFSMERHPATNTINFAVSPIFSRTVPNYDELNQTPFEIFANNRGYIVVLNNDGVENMSSNQLNIRIDKFTDDPSPSRITLDQGTVYLDYEEVHHLNITRTLDFKMDVRIDNELELSISETEDSAIDYSEKFTINLIHGKIDVDNISVTEFKEPETSDGFIGLVSIVALITIIKLKRIISKK